MWKNQRRGGIANGECKAVKGMYGSKSEREEGESERQTRGGEQKESERTCKLSSTKRLAKRDKHNNNATPCTFEHTHTGHMEIHTERRQNKERRQRAQHACSKAKRKPTRERCRTSAETLTLWSSLLPPSVWVSGVVSCCLCDHFLWSSSATDCSG